MRISAAVLTGGRSRRMGRDKLFLPVGSHATLLARQLDVLAAVGPCEWIVAARTDQVLPRLPRGVLTNVVRDDGRAGPLGGLVAILRAARAPRVLVLGVDVAAISPGMLRRIVGAAPEADEGIGVMPQAAGHPQPLAALWSRAMLPWAEAQLAAGGDLSLRTLVAAGSAAGRFRWLDLPAGEARAFANWNRPLDVLAGRIRALP